MHIVVYRLYRAVNERDGGVRPRDVGFPTYRRERMNLLSAPSAWKEERDRSCTSTSVSAFSIVLHRDDTHRDKTRKNRLISSRTALTSPQA